MSDTYFLFNTTCNKITIDNPRIKVKRPWERVRKDCIINNSHDFRMRRKAEILQYKNTAFNRTKKQKYILAVRNNLTNRTWSSDINPNTNNLKTFGKISNVINGKIIESPKGLICNKNNSVMTSYSYQCDVPGPVIQLTYNKNLPNLFRNNPLRTYKGSNNSWPQF